MGAGQPRALPGTGNTAAPGETAAGRLPAGPCPAALLLPPVPLLSMTSFHSHTPGDTSGGSPNPSGRVSSGGEAEGGSAHSGLLLSPQKGAGGRGRGPPGALAGGEALLSWGPWGAGWGCWSPSKLTCSLSTPFPLGILIDRALEAGDYRGLKPLALRHVPARGLCGQARASWEAAAMAGEPESHAVGQPLTLGPGRLGGVQARSMPSWGLRAPSSPSRKQCVPRSARAR